MVELSHGPYESVTDFESATVKNSISQVDHLRTSTWPFKIYDVFITSTTAWLANESLSRYVYFDPNLRNGDSVKEPKAY
jgi:hypothetical protein